MAAWILQNPASTHRAMLGDIVILSNNYNPLYMLYDAEETKITTSTFLFICYNCVGE